MRVSTFQYYQLNTNNILDKQSKVNDSIIKMSEGKRVITASDDSVAANSILNFKQEVRVTDQYQRNIEFAEARLKTEETALASIEDLMLRIKDLALQGNNGSLGQDAKEAIAQEMENRLEELLSIANTRDESGSYIFSGYQTEQIPFSQQPDKTVQYNGDLGVRETTIGSSVSVETNDPGQTVFIDVPNSVGDFRPAYGATNNGRAFVESANIVDPANYDATLGDYQINFVDLDGDEVIEYQLFDGAGNRLPPLPGPPDSNLYEPGQPISYNGFEIVITGDPEVGDTIDLTEQRTKDIFSSVQDAIDWMRRSRDTDQEKALRQVEMGHIVSDLNQSMLHITSTRSNVGSRLQVITSQDMINEDYKITVQTAQSNLEDLDIAEASTTFSRQTVALQAAQQSFAQVQSLTLFNYI
ncbi:flagellar hook-associated protein FlgL [Neiella marina]|uniref:Flagellar hook-associated protein FlgL n=1 Tax=Neiella marina TaxID=508461 RepID=A0A8J2XQ23_9GAMM|nr:flagellar hook-associated protein FlgL [Neiella marina]GGA90379.1 flagellar hook-associated protein FlgL [Neiella marina]